MLGHIQRGIYLLGTSSGLFQRVGLPRAIQGPTVFACLLLVVLSVCYQCQFDSASGRHLLGGAAGHLRLLLVAAGDWSADVRLRGLGVLSSRHQYQHPGNAGAGTRMVLALLLEVPVAPRHHGEC